LIDNDNNDDDDDNKYLINKYLDREPSLTCTDHILTTPFSQDDARKTPEGQNDRDETSLRCPLISNKHEQPWYDEAS
jgi:hypothetical protein